MMDVAALYVDSAGPYTLIEGVHCYAGEHAVPSLFSPQCARDAMDYAGPLPVVAHPPCGHWGLFSWNCKQPKAWKDAGPVAVQQVRRWGGVLEHPANSALWPACGLPGPKDGHDEYGGWTLSVNQTRWGHRCMKPTWLYIVGVQGPLDLPPLPLDRPPTHVMVRQLSNGSDRPELPKKLRHITPTGLAEWLVCVARLSVTV